MLSLVTLVEIILAVSVVYVVSSLSVICTIENAQAKREEAFGRGYQPGQLGRWTKVFFGPGALISALCMIGYAKATRKISTRLGIF